MSSLALEMVRTVPHHDSRTGWIELIEKLLRFQTNALFITLPYNKTIRYDEDDSIENYIRPIFTSAIQHLVGDHYDQMQFPKDDHYIFSGCVIAENRTKQRSSIATHLHLLTNIRDLVIDKFVVADRVICSLLGDRPDREVGHYVPTRHKLLQSEQLRKNYWVDDYRDKETLFPDRKGGAPIIHYSIYQSGRSLNSWRTSIDLRKVTPLRGFKSKDIDVQIKPRQLKSHLIRHVLAPYGLKNNESNILSFSSRNVSDDINRVIPFQF